MTKPTLVIMAAGMGSRYGGLKQIDPIDPQGHIIMDYSIYDAVQAGFGKVIFIIKKENEADFRESIGNRMEKRIPVEYVFQDLHNIPDGYEVPEGRVKPWGTGHAVLSCLPVVDGPFAVINADDYYGKEAFVKVHDYLVEEHPASDKLDFCMAGFLLENTLSENGGVTRGICSVNEQGHLTKVTETKNIVKTAEGAAVQAEDGSLTAVQAHCPVSMNMWGFTPEIFGILEKGFAEFLGALKDQTKGEYLIPTVVDQLIQTGVCNVTVLESRDKWFGVTYKEDKPLVVRSFRELIDAGVYKERLFD